MAQKYYAVRKGRQPGIYRTWPETQKQVSGYPQAQYKSFTSEKDAQDFMAGKAIQPDQLTLKSVSNQAPVNAAITVYTDGGSRNTGNVAGQHVHQDDKAAWAYRIEMPDQLVTDSAGEWGATNNRMEIMAFLRALGTLRTSLAKSKTGDLFRLDSAGYVLNAVTKGWLAGWKRRGWKRSNGPLVNAELWREVDRLLPAFTALNYRWTKGHATNQGNVFVDHLLNQTMIKCTLVSRPASTGAKISPQPAKTSVPQPTMSNPTPTKSNQSATVRSTPAEKKPVDPEQVARSVAAIKKMLRDN